MEKGRILIHDDYTGWATDQKQYKILIIEDFDGQPLSCYFLTVPHLPPEIYNQYQQYSFVLN
jgi:hypothetical protein